MAPARISSSSNDSPARNGGDGIPTHTNGTLKRYNGKIHIHEIIKGGLGLHNGKNHIIANEPTEFTIVSPVAEREAKIAVTVGQDGATTSIKFRGLENDFSPTYLLMEGIHLHAKINPDGLCLRLPRLENYDSYIDVNYKQAAAIVDHLMTVIKAQFENHGVKIIPGNTVVALSALPYAHSFFHQFALWQLGCTVQYFNHELGRDAVDSLISSSKVLLHAGLILSEKAELGIKEMAQRIGVIPIEIAEQHYSINLALLSSLPGAREPRDLAEFDENFNDKTVLFIIHTSGSTGIPKLVKWDFYVTSRVIRLAPHIKINEANYTRPLMMVSRGHWGTSSFLALSCVAMGCSLAYSYPQDRLYASTKQALDSCASCNAASLLVYPAQAMEIIDLVDKDKKYKDILDNIPTIQWAGAGLDHLVAEQLSKLTGPTKFMNLHGLSELGFSGLTATSHPLNGLQDAGGYALWEPMEEQFTDTNNRLVKLWISLDKHPIAWYYIQNKLSPIKAQRFPGPGPKKDRPAVDTGDIFEERQTLSGEYLYYHHSRDDDVIRLSNLYRPDVGELESRFSKSCNLSSISNEVTLDAVQIMGDKKTQMAMIVQFKTTEAESTSMQIVRQAGLDAVNDLNETLPMKVRFSGLNRVKIIVIKQGEHDDLILLKTHKATLRRRINVINFGPWLDSLDM